MEKSRVIINSLVPELSISNIYTSLHFYIDLLGFTIVYQRSAEGFAFIQLGAAQIMLDEIGKTRTWNTDASARSLGLGVNLQIKVESLESVLKRLASKHIPLFMNEEIKWYRCDEMEIGQKQFLVKDPDGYLLRFVEELGTRTI